MRRTLFALCLLAPFLLVPGAYGQEAAGPGRFEIGVFPVGGVFFTNGASASEPDFGNFALGATVTWRGSAKARVGRAILPSATTSCAATRSGDGGSKRSAS
mgnify:CR=1 FL=1